MLVSALIINASELISCDYSFYQGIDEKGQAQTGVKVSDISLTYESLPSQETLNWAMNRASYLNGALVLYDANDIPLKKLFFKDAACVGLHLSYAAYGNSPILTQINVKPRKFIVDDITLDQRWTNVQGVGTPQSLKQNNSTGQTFPIAQPLSKFTLDLNIEDRTYEIENFSTSFTQGVDHKGQPQNEISAGVISFSIASLPTEQLNRWMLKSDMLKDGEFVFKRGDQNSPLKINFTEAFCVNMANRTTGRKGMLTDITISANEISMNEKSCYNYFKL